MSGAWTNTLKHIKLNFVISTDTFDQTEPGIFLKAKEILRIISPPCLFYVEIGMLQFIKH